MPTVTALWVERSHLCVGHMLGLLGSGDRLLDNSGELGHSFEMRGVRYSRLITCSSKTEDGKPASPASNTRGGKSRQNPRESNDT